MKNDRTTAFDLDRAVAEWVRKLRRSEALEDGPVAELEAHVRDEIEDLIGRGKSPEAAFREVTGSVEAPDAIGAEYYKSDGRGLLAALPGRAIGYSPALFFNSVKVSLRKMKRQKWYSLISVSGLAAGMACSILILLWVSNELSYDRFHANAGNIHRVIMEDHRADGVSVHPWLSFPLGPALKNEFPEIAAVTRWAPEDMVVRYGDEAHTETRFLTVDPVFFEMFSFRFVEGTPGGALAVFISCLGLVGLSSYMAEERTKEIGIRKVLGASAPGVVSLFSMDFIKLVILSNAVAWPIGYLVMHRWLQAYAYRTSIGLGVFALAGGLGLLTAVLSVGWQTLRVATADPIESLRYE